MAYNFPKPCLLEIFKRLDTITVLELSLVSKRWNLVANSALLWKDKFHKNFYVPVIETELDLEDTDDNYFNGDLTSVSMLNIFWEQIKNAVSSVSRVLTNYHYYHYIQLYLTSQMEDIIVQTKGFLATPRYNRVANKFINRLLQTDVLLTPHVCCACGVCATVLNLQLPRTFVDKISGIDELCFTYAPSFTTFTPQLEKLIEFIRARPLMYKPFDFNRVSPSDGCTMLTRSLTKYFANPNFYWSLTKVLLKIDNVNPNKMDANGNTPLLCAVANSGSHKFVNKLGFEYILPSDAPTEDEDNMAICISQMAELGVDLNAPNRFGTYPILLAYSLKQSKIASLLLRLGANPTITSGNGTSLPLIAKTQIDKKLTVYQNDLVFIEQSVMVLMVIVFLFLLANMML